MKLIFREIGERAREALQDDDQKETLQTYAAALQQKAQEFK